MNNLKRPFPFHLVTASNPIAEISKYPAAQIEHYLLTGKVPFIVGRLACYYSLYLAARGASAE